MSEDYMKYDGSVPEPPYTTISDFMDQVAELEAQLAACAAGAWRYDVENAEIGQFYWCCYGEDEYEVCSLNMMHQWRNTMNCYMPPPIAFAVPNPPQVQKAQSFDIPQWHDNDSGGYVQ